MNRSLLTGFLLFVLLLAIGSESYACDGIPIADIKGDYTKYVSHNHILNFDGSDSYDNDPPPEESYCIVEYDWDWPSAAYDIWESLDGRRTAKARFTPTGEYEVELDVKDDEDIWSTNLEECVVRVVEVGLSADKYICVNDDDDNVNGTPDKDDPNALNGDDDLVALSLSVSPTTNWPNCKVQLTVVGDNKDCIKIWNDPNKQELVIPDGSYYWKKWNPGDLPGTLWVEGITSTPAEDHVLVSLKYKPYPWDEVYQSDNYSVKFIVVKVGIDAGLSEKDELDPGKYINVNWDDDDNDGWEPNDAPPDGSYTGDKSDPNIDGGDDDLRPFIVSRSPWSICQDFPNSKVSITFPSNVKVWQTNTKKTVMGESSELISGHEFVIENLPKQLYLEGVSGSSAFKDVELKATWLPKSFNDFVKVTVFEVDLTGLFGFGSQQADDEIRHSSWTFPGSSDKNGKISWDDANADGTKGDMDPNCEYFHNCMECQGTIKPCGVTTEVEFDFYREMWYRAWKKKEGENWLFVKGYTLAWTDDEIQSDEDLTPSIDNHIYQTDGPGWATRDRGPTWDYLANIGDFRERVKVKIDGVWYWCSDFYKWHFKCYTKPKDVNYMTRDVVELQQLGSGWITVPDTP